MRLFQALLSFSSYLSPIFLRPITLKIALNGKNLPSVGGLKGKVSPPGGSVG